MKSFLIFLGCTAAVAVAPAVLGQLVCWAVLMAGSLGLAACLLADLVAAMIDRGEP